MLYYLIMKLSIMNSRWHYWFVAIFILALVLVSFIILPPHLWSDSYSYLKSIEVLKTGNVLPGFIPNRILTTYAGLKTIIFFSYIFGNVLKAWLFINIALYVIANLFFYRALEEFFENRKVAFWGMILLATNYAMITFGPTYLMDMGGWAFYFIALFFSFRFLKTGNMNYVLTGALLTGFGGLFKEYGFLGFIPLISALIFHFKNNIAAGIKRAIIITAIALLPVSLLYGFIYISYGYSYLNLLAFTQNNFAAGFETKLISYLKVFGSLFTFGWFLFLGGIYAIIKQGKNIFDSKRQIFLAAILLSAIPPFVWPAITQRVMFIAMPFFIIISCVFIKKYESRPFYYIPFIILYIVANFAMDKYILPFFNISELFKILF